jgi:HPt (histidine-containing phosphotransfer) domain-containing protein
VPKPLTLDQVDRMIAALIPSAPGAATPVSPVEATAPTQRVPSQAVFDRVLIDQYRDVLGDRSATQMVEIFVQTLAERTTELQRAIDAGDIAEVNRVGHTIKGMAAAIGATTLSECGLELQHATLQQVAEAHGRFLQESTDVLAGVHAAWKLSTS